MVDRYHSKLEWNDFKNILKTFIVISVPIIIVFILLQSYISNREIERTKTIIIKTKKQNLKLVNYIIDDIFEEMNEDLMLVQNSAQLTNFLQKPDSHKSSEVEQLFLRIVKSKPMFFDLTVLNPTGQELIKVRHPLNHATLIPAKELRNQTQTTYYQRASQLTPGEIYASNLHLSSQDKDKSQSATPLITIATPLYSQDNRYQGVLVINYDCKDILHAFNNQLEDLEYPLTDSALLTATGDYIFSSSPGHELNIISPESTTEPLAKTYPELWRTITQRDSGSFEDTTEIHCFRKIYPLKKMKVAPANSYYWVLLSSFCFRDLPLVKQIIILGMRSLDLLILLGICLLILGIVTIYYYQNKSREQLNLTTKIARETHDAVVITDKDTNIIYVNKAFELITGYTLEEVIGLKTSYFKSGKHSKKFYKEMWDSLNNTGYWHGELWDKKKDGVFYPKKLSIIAVTRDKSQSVEKYIGIFSDLTKIKEEQKNVTKLKNYNFDTNLPNENLLKRLLKESIKNDPNIFGVVCFSVANYNNLLLKGQGDAQKYINTLIANIEELIKPDDFLAQISKNLFVLGISAYNDKEEVELFIHHFIHNNKNSLYIDNEEILLDIKAGISLYPQDGTNPDELLNSAHIALETVLKTKGKNHLYFKPELKASILQEIKMNYLLRNALNHQELDIFYQPQVSITQNRAIGAEALLRWNNSELGQVSPNVFIPLAERSGQIIEIGYWVFERVFQNYLELQDIIDPDFVISINISPLQFMDKYLIKKFSEIAAKYQIDLKNFEIEITEGIFMHDINQVNQNLNQLRELGLSIAIDDFGTGFSSLSYLKNLNVDKLKIDRSFIKDYPTSDRGELAKVITDISNELQLKVITEGVETREQLDYISSIGCDLIQGYYYSKPLPKNSFAEYLTQQNTTPTT